MGLVFGRRLLYHTRGIHFPPRSPGFAGSVDSRKLSGGRKAPKRAEDCPDLGAANEGNGSGTCRVSRGLQNNTTIPRVFRLITTPTKIPMVFRLIITRQYSLGKLPQVKKSPEEATTTRFYMDIG